MEFLRAPAQCLNRLTVELVHFIERFQVIQLIPDGAPNNGWPVRESRQYGAVSKHPSRFGGSVLQLREKVFTVVSVCQPGYARSPLRDGPRLIVFIIYVSSPTRGGEPGGQSRQPAHPIVTTHGVVPRQMDK